MAITSNPQIQNGAVSVGNGTRSFLNISATTAVKSTAGRVCTINVIAGGSASGAVYDRATTSGIGTANAVAVIPSTVGTYNIDFPCANGIVVAPPAGSTITVSFN
ncbi:MAG: hypothetical protein ACOYMH_00075 [Zwartia sp.]